MPAIFVSYRRDDSAGYAGRLRESLEERFGRGQVFRDVDTLEPGQDFVLAIEARVAACRAFLAVIGRDWLTATDRDGRPRLQQPEDHVRREIAAALARPDLLVVPVLTEGVPMPASEDLPDDLKPIARRHAISLRDDSWREDVDRLATTLERALVDSRPAHAPLPATAAESTSSPRGRRAARIAAGSVAVVAVTGIALVLARGVALVREPTEPDPGAAGDVPAPAGAGDRAFLVELPDIAEFEIAEQVHSVLYATLDRPAAGARTLRLRFRSLNESPYSVFLGESLFRLVMEPDRLAPAEAPSLVLAPRSVEDYAVSFAIGRDARHVVLRLDDGLEAAELALDLATGRPLAVRDTLTATAPARDRTRNIAIDRLRLRQTPDEELTLARVTVRPFANKLRITATLDFANRSPNYAFFGSDALRLILDGEPRAPVGAPSDAVPPRSTVSGDFVFEVPVSTRRVALRVTGGPNPADHPLDLRPALR